MLVSAFTKSNKNVKILLKRLIMFYRRRNIIGQRYKIQSKGRHIFRTLKVNFINLTICDGNESSGSEELETSHRALGKYKDPYSKNAMSADMKD